MDVDRELGSDPLVPALPARAVQEDVLPVLGHVPHQVVCEPEVGRGGVEQLPEFGVVDLDQSLFHLGGTQAQVRVWRSGGHPCHAIQSTCWGAGAGNERYG